MLGMEKNEGCSELTVCSCRYCANLRIFYGDSSAKNEKFKMRKFVKYLCPIKQIFLSLFFARLPSLSKAYPLPDQGKPVKTHFCFMSNIKEFHVKIIRFKNSRGTLLSWKCYYCQFKITEVVRSIFFIQIYHDNRIGVTTVLLTIC